MEQILRENLELPCLDEEKENQIFQISLNRRVSDNTARVAVPFRVIEEHPLLRKITFGPDCEGERGSAIEKQEEISVETKEIEYVIAKTISAHQMMPINNL